MKWTRRDLAKAMAAASVPRLARAAEGPDIAKGPFQPTRDSLRAWRCPDWFRDAKFGIWAHWGPQSAAEYGDWYARNMYIEGNRQYKYHCEKYGHPSKFGFKDIIPTWKAEKFDADALMQLYAKAGAKYFVSMAVHHDNFDLWNSKLNPWNSTKMGPKMDIVGLFRKAAQKHGLKFGVSEHLAVSYHWFQTSHGADKEGPQKGVPYDGADPKFASLYHETHEAPKNAWDPAGVPLKWKQHYFARVRDLLDKYEPDLLYTDGPIFFEEWGLGVAAHFYNSNAKRNGGKVEAVYANKGKTDCDNGICLLDVERGVVDKTWPEPWQTDTCIGRWHYDKEATYKSPKMVIDLLVDIVSRNGNLLLNFPLPSSGALDDKELQILGEITRWMSVNGELIYGSRPWKVFGSGPATDVDTAERPGAGAHHVAGAFNENKRKQLTAEDVRFIQKGNTLVAFLMDWPGDKPVLIRELGSEDGAVTGVELQGSSGKVEWSQNTRGLTVKMPPERPCEHAVALKIKG